MNRSVRRQIPNFSLYGERSADTRTTDPLHVEDIQSRSRKYLWKIATHRHAGLCQCVYVTSGPVEAQLEEASAASSGPVIFIIPSGTVHGFGFLAETRGYVLTADLDRLMGMAGPAHQAAIAALFSIPRCIALEAEPSLAMRLSQFFESLMREFNQPESVLVPVSGWLACSILWIIASTHPAASHAAPFAPSDLDRLRRFRVLLESHYLQHWPVKRYARELALSESSLNRLCASLTGNSAFVLIQQRLALESRRRLVYVAGSVAAIAAELGFNDPAYFCRFFRKHAGLSPTEFRRLQGDG
jgi:AraC family transcriptional activator of pobA